MSGEVLDTRRPTHRWTTCPRAIIDRFRERHGEVVEIAWLPGEISNLESLHEYARALPA